MSCCVTSGKYRSCSASIFMKGLCCLRGQWYPQWEGAGTELKILAHGSWGLSVLCRCFRDLWGWGWVRDPVLLSFFLCMRFYIWFSEFQKKKKRIQKIIPCYLEILEAMRSFLILELTFSPSAHPLGTEPCKDAISSTVHRHGGQELKHGWHPLIMPISKR